MSQEKAAKPRVGLLNTIGAMAFFVGVLLSIVGGIFSQDNGTIILILVILGIIMGLFNISAKEVATFLIAAIALMKVGKRLFFPGSAAQGRLSNSLVRRAERRHPASRSLTGGLSWSGSPC